MRSIKLNNIEKIAQGRVSSGFSPNPVQDIRTMSKWVIELVAEVRRLDGQRRVYRARVKAIHNLISQYPEHEESVGHDTDYMKGHNEGSAELAQDIRKILAPDVDA